MTTSKRIAGLIGPTSIAIGTSEAINFRIWETNSAPLISLNGVLLFVAGLSIVRARIRWTRGWPVIVTLVGWTAILGGLFRMFAPEAQKAGENVPTTIITASLVTAVGVFLPTKAYLAERLSRGGPEGLPDHKQVRSMQTAFQAAVEGIADAPLEGPERLIGSLSFGELAVVAGLAAAVRAGVGGHGQQRPPSLGSHICPPASRRK